MKIVSTALLATMCLAQLAVASAESIKIGFVTTLTTGGAVIGNDQRDAVNLAIEQMDATMGGQTVEVLFEDDGFKPETGKQVTDKLIKEDEVDIVAGYIWSHVLMASYKSVTKAGKIVISANAGPSPLAGKLCNENFFSVSWQNDQTPMAMGELLNKRGVESLYVMAPNYAAGKDMAAGVARTFKGEIIGKDLTKWGADAQLDFSAELAKAKASGAKGLFVFYPGKAGGAFLKQYQQAGLAETLPLYTVFTVDALSLPKLQEADMQGILGTEMTQFWSPDMENAANQRFVSSFREKYGRYPSFYAAQAYDSMFLIKSAADALDGDLSDTAATREALQAANFDSVRGDFTFGSNHFPIQDFFAREVVVDEEGNWTTAVTNRVMEDHVDSYATECSL
ncbi:MAG: ABC transporter substrate-binding protein [Granulosicoccus sp.]